MTAEGGVQYSKIAEIKGPLVIVDDVENAAFDELVEVETKEGERRLGKFSKLETVKQSSKSLRELLDYPLLQQMQNLSAKLWRCQSQEKYSVESLMV